MPCSPTEVAVHRLNINKESKVVQQKKRTYAAEKRAAAEEEVGKLIKAGFIRESKYPTWLSNVVMVKKPNGKWRMCVDFTDLNRACPKDCFPLPRIDQMVDSVAGHELLSFLDAFSGYHQISLAPEDRVHTSFLTEYGTYCYQVMPFGLKNAGATYQRMVTEVFKPLLGTVMEAYVDDMVVKSHHAKDHVLHLQQVFKLLNENNMRLNPEKCTFGVPAGKFLEYLVTNQGIKLNPEKIKSITDMHPPTTVIEVQRLREDWQP